MKSYTLRQLGMDVSGEKFILPFDVDEKDETIFDKVIKMFDDADIYERELYKDRDEQDTPKVNEWGYLEVKFLYESYEGYIPFKMVMEVFRYDATQEKPKYDPRCSSFHDQFVEWKPVKIYIKNNENDNKKEVKDGQLMVSILFEHEEGALLDELIDLNTKPDIIKKLNLKGYSYN